MPDITYEFTPEGKTTYEVRSITISEPLFKVLVSPRVPNVIRYLFEDMVGYRFYSGVRRPDRAKKLKLKPDGTLGMDFFSIKKDAEDPTVTFLSLNRLKGEPTGYVWLSKQRQEMKLSKWLRALFTEETLKERQIADAQVEQLVNALKAHQAEQKSEKEYTIQEVSGRDITYWYNSENYVSGGSLGTSCMKWSGKPENNANHGSYACYEACPNARLVIVLSRDGRLLGRAVLWTASEFYEYMPEKNDRPRKTSNYSYANNMEYRNDMYNDYFLVPGEQRVMMYAYVAKDFVYEIMKKYAEEKGYYRLDRYSGGFWSPAKKNTKAIFRIAAGRREGDGLSQNPYFDSVHYYPDYDFEHYYYGVLYMWGARSRKSPYSYYSANSYQFNDWEELTKRAGKLEAPVVQEPSAEVLVPAGAHEVQEAHEGHDVNPMLARQLVAEQVAI